MVNDVAGSPGDLPLLQYTLTELWQHKILNRLVLSEYTRLGGVKKALEEHANQVYKSIKTDEEKLAAKRIFLSLINIGEGSEDTHKQVRQPDLVTPQQSQELVDHLVKHLADNKLVVTAEQEVNGERVAVVNIVHEALIRNWDLFSSWLKENREALVIEKPIQAAAEVWRDNKKRGESAYLLRGTRLGAAEDYLQRYDKSFPLSLLAQEFVQKSIKHRRNNRLRLISAVSAVILPLTGLTIFANFQRIEADRRRLIAEIEGQGFSALKQFESGGKEIESLLSAMQAGQQLKALVRNNQPSQDYPTAMPLYALQKILYNIRELKQFRGHQSSVLSASFSPNGQLLATASSDHTVRLWDLKGKQLQIFQGHEKGVESVKFSPDGQRLATASDDGTARL